MASKCMEKVVSMPLRSSQRGKITLPLLVSAPTKSPSHSDSDSDDSNNLISVQNQQQLKQKQEKETPFSPSNDASIVPNAQDKPRRTTRSSRPLPSNLKNETEIQQDPCTPEDSPIIKFEEQPTWKKLVKPDSNQELSDSQLIDINHTIKKISIKPCQNLASPYSEIRKSYRKVHKREIVSVPYRKCHDPLEGRIVTIINKIEAGKNCIRQFESLIEKMHKISTKDMLNRFVVAGIRTIIAIAVEKNIYDPKLIEKLEEEQKNLQKKIIDELERIEEYDYSQEEYRVELIDKQTCRMMYIKKLYILMKRRNPQKSKHQVKQKVLLDCEKLFDQQFNLGVLVKNLKNRIETPH